MAATSFKKDVRFVNQNKSIPGLTKFQYRSQRLLNLRSIGTKITSCNNVQGLAKKFRNG